METTIQSMSTAVKTMEDLLKNKMESAELTNQIFKELEEKSKSVISGIEEYKRLVSEHIRLLGEYRENALIVHAAFLNIKEEQDKVIIKIEEMAKIR